MTLRTLFPTFFSAEVLDAPDLLAALEESTRAFAREDRAGRAWSRAHGYRGYTSYASLDDLPQRDPAFAELKRVLDRHVARFLAEAGLRPPAKPRLNGLWVNLLKPGGAHSGHLHPHSSVSGTLYLAVPAGSGALRLEDPRLAMLMAAPARDDSFVYVEPQPGSLFLWESWLRHEVMPNAARSERISISFNYR